MFVIQVLELVFDYIEGFVVLKNKDFSYGWNFVFFDVKKIDFSIIFEEGGFVLYCIEFVKKFSLNYMDILNKV